MEWGMVHGVRTVGHRANLPTWTGMWVYPYPIERGERGVREALRNNEGQAREVL